MGSLPRLALRWFGAVFREGSGELEGFGVCWYHLGLFCEVPQSVPRKPPEWVPLNTTYLDRQNAGFAVGFSSNQARRTLTNRNQYWFHGMAGLFFYSPHTLFTQVTEWPGNEVVGRCRVLDRYLDAV